ncbi:MAG: hypothetical protein K8S18_17855 [Desulfobacula sp.]|nr:hypothetical protein [Desulfobacula sp.]
MKERIMFVLMILIVFVTEKSLAQEKSNDFPILTGPYLGQKPPGSQAEIFAPGIVSTGNSEFCSVFSPDGNEFYWSVSGAPYPTIVMMRYMNNHWSKPEIGSFSGKYLDFDMAFMPNGNQLFFCSRRPLEGNGPPIDNTDLWFVERENVGWSEPRHLKGPVNSKANEYYPIFAQNGTLYFSSARPGGYGNGDIYFSRFENGMFLEPENLGAPINTENAEGDLYIAPDESYIIVTCYGRPDAIGSGDLYISFRQEDSSWSSMKNMGPSVNSIANEHCPILSPDGKYFFFSSGRSHHSDYSNQAITYDEKVEIMNTCGNGWNEDIYWIFAEVIEKLRP